MEQDRENSEIDTIRKHSDLGGKTVLEVGCGDGRASAMLAPHVKHLVAIDPDAAQLATARANVPGVDFRQGSGENLEFPDGSFDIVAFTFSLHHQDPARALEEAHRVLRPGGQALVIEPSVDGEMHRFFRLFRDEDLRLAATLEYLRNTKRFRVQKSETFNIRWIFDDSEDLYRYFFERNRMARTHEQLDKIDFLLGGKKKDRPIFLTEIVTIFSLTKVE